jgi:hypothetical protein
MLYVLSTAKPYYIAPSADIANIIVFTVGCVGIFAYLWNLTPFPPPAAQQETHIPQTPAFMPQTPPFVPQTPPFEPLSSEFQSIQTPNPPPLVLEETEPDVPPTRTLTNRQTKIYKITSLSIQQVKDKILTDPTNLYLKNLLLKKLEAKGEQKCVASYSKLDKNTGLVLQQKITLPITASNFTVSTVRGNQKIRVHLTKAALTHIQKKNSHLKNLKVYE